ncbi:MAG: methyltransferase, TIGR04325 family [Bernardetiaceae bacterium]
MPLRHLKNLFFQPPPPAPKPVRQGVYWEGNHELWELAQTLCPKGYSDEQILDRVREATLKVKRGEAAYERDSVTFDEIQHNWAMLAHLFYVAMQHQGQLYVIDFGGALGSLYFQHRAYLNDLSDFRWTVVEQPHFVRCGQKEVAFENLYFAYTVEEAIHSSIAHVLVLSGVLQYLPDPYATITKLKKHRFPYLIIDRTAFIEDAPDRLTIQHTPEAIIQSAYPAWFFNKDRFLAAFAEDYEILATFDSGYTPPFQLEDDKRGYWYGFVLKRKP